MTTREIANKIQHLSKELDPDRVLEIFKEAGWSIKSLSEIGRGVIAMRPPPSEGLSSDVTDRWALIGRKPLSAGSKLWCFPDEKAIELLELEGLRVQLEFEMQQLVDEKASEETKEADQVRPKRRGQ